MEHPSSSQLPLMALYTVERVRWWLWVRPSRAVTAWRYQYCRNYAIWYIPREEWGSHRSSRVSGPRLHDLMSTVRASHAMGILRAHGCTSQDHPDFPMLVTPASSDAGRFWPNMKTRGNRGGLRMELTTMEFLYGPAPTLFYLEHRVTPGVAAGRRHADRIYKNVVWGNPRPHLRYSTFFLTSEEDPLGIKDKKAELKFVSDRLHHLSELNARRYLKLSDPTQPAPRVLEQVESLTELQINQAPAVGWTVHGEQPRFRPDVRS